MPKETKSTYRVLRDLLHDKQPFRKNDGINLTDAEAAHLVETRAIEPYNAEAPIVVKNSSEDDGSDTPVNLEKLTKNQLIEHAQTFHKLTLDPTKTNREMIAAIQEEAAKA